MVSQFMAITALISVITRLMICFIICHPSSLIHQLQKCNCCWPRCCLILDIELGIRLTAGFRATCWNGFWSTRARQFWAVFELVIELHVGILKCKLNFMVFTLLHLFLSGDVLEILVFWWFIETKQYNHFE